jgi:hypothetical protein
MLKDVHYYDEVHPLGVKISGIGDSLKCIPSQNNGRRMPHMLKSETKRAFRRRQYTTAGLTFDQKSQGSQLLSDNAFVTVFGICSRLLMEEMIEVD